MTNVRADHFFAKRLLKTRRRPPLRHSRMAPIQWSGWRESSPMLMFWIPGSALRPPVCVRTRTGRRDDDLVAGCRVFQQPHYGYAAEEK